MSGRGSLAAFLSLALVLALADQAVKQAVMWKFALGESVPVVPGVLNLIYIRNRGAAFGLLSAVPGPWVRWFFVVATAAALAFVFYLFRYQSPHTWHGRAALVLVFGGGLGNLVDRIFYGEVIDFIDVYYAAYHWPAFNLADSCISVGLGLLIFDFLWRPRGPEVSP